GRMKKEGFPFDAVIIDLFWFGDGVHGAWNMGNLDWDRKRFPRPEEMIRQLADQQIKTILITEPFVLAESFNYLSTQQEKLHAVNQQGDTVGIKEFYFGHAGLLDIFQQKTKDWFWSKYDAQIQKGVAGWWGDLGEPEKHPDYLYHNLKDQGHDRLFSADEVHNLYGHLWSQMLFEKYAQHYPNQRLFHLNRSGYAGTWRYGSFPWSGDVDRSWKGLRAQLPVMMGTGLSGIPTMHSDAGGFAMGQRDPELYRRWLQMAVFSPIFRPHGSVAAPEANAPSIESEPVFYDEPDKSILRSTIELRYRLMPYVYNLARESARNGSPFVRPLFYTDTSDRELFNATDQYYFGPHLLVAPVLEPGATTRRLYLPRGDWYDFHRPTERLQGGRWMEVPTEAATIPVFVKAGAVVPMKPVFENTGSYPAGKWIFHYYPAAGDSYNSFYEDDGQATDALEKNKYEEIRVKTTRKGRRTRVEISATGSYPGQPEKRVVDLWIHGVGNPRLVNVNNSRTSNFSREGNSIRVSGLNWNGQSLRVELRQ
ncbi:MAG TPA: glycoside hydrolase family 31 protein, partial [Lacibacter sp.]|nr:glycoside hydrolase family 31 protein [Lacibacter sp.]